ncbi:hypothetical protein DSECCO2_341860 [anaerobic digester metagenome]
MFEGVNGIDRKNVSDITLFCNQMTWIADYEPLAVFENNKDARNDFTDVTWLFNHL